MISREKAQTAQKENRYFSEGHLVSASGATTRLRRGRESARAHTFLLFLGFQVFLVGLQVAVVTVHLSIIITLRTLQFALGILQTGISTIHRPLGRFPIVFSFSFENRRLSIAIALIRQTDSIFTAPEKGITRWSGPGNDLCRGRHNRVSKEGKASKSKQGMVFHE